MKSIRKNKKEWYSMSKCAKNWESMINMSKHGKVWEIMREYEEISQKEWVGNRNWAKKLRKCEKKCESLKKGATGKKLW